MTTTLSSPSQHQEKASFNINAGLTYDVVVMGGGVSGSVAAIAAARAGARVLLVEEHGFLGGSLTSMGVGPMMSFHNPAGEQVVRGIPDEIIERLKARGASLGHIIDTTTYCSTVTPFDSEELKIELETMLIEAGGQVLYHTQLAAAERGNDNISRIIVCNKAGLTAISAKIFIDATGDGDLAARSGASFQKGRPSDGAAQPMTMNLKLANVDIAAIRKYVRENPDNFLWAYGKEEALKRLEASPRVSIAGFLSQWNEALKNGEVDVPRDHVLFFETPVPGVVIVNTSRVVNLDGTDPFQLSQAESIGRRQCVQILQFLRKRCVGFEKAIRMDTAAKIGVRETRHIIGRYTITADDILTSRAFDDTIALGGYPIDIHTPGKGTCDTTHLERDTIYQIPLRSLLVDKAPENLIVVGRCISATHEAAGAFRVTPISMAIGQGGGVAAAEAIRLGVLPGKVPYAVIRDRLESQGARVR